MPRGPRTGYAWRQAVLKVKADTIICSLCGNWIDKNLKWPDPRSFSVDHIVPVNLGGSVLDRANLRGSHLGCNASRGDGTRTRRNRSLDLGCSREW